MRRFDRVARGACASHLGRPSFRPCYGGASPFTRRRVAVIACGVLVGPAGLLADDHAEARFRGERAETNTVRITSVRRQGGPLRRNSLRAEPASWPACRAVRRRGQGWKADLWLMI